MDVGQRTEGAILGELVRRGYHVLSRSASNSRYDLVMDIEGKFVRAQCKTGRLRDGCVVFSARSVQSNTRRAATRGYRGEIEIFLVYCEATGQIYSVPVEDVGACHIYLRVDAPRNNQARRIRWAKDYELPA